MSRITYVLSALLFMIQFACARDYVHGNGFRAISDYQIEDYSCHFAPSEMQDKAIIFIKTDFLEYFFTNILPFIKNRIILITHNSDYPAPGCFASYLEHPNILMWFGQNCDCALHPKFIPIPIGIANPCWAHGDQKVFDKVLDSLEQDKTFKKQHYLYINFSDTNPVRPWLQKIFSNNPFAIHACAKPLADYLLEMARYRYVLSPFGNGLDCLRTWEALLVGSVPVVKTSTLDPLYADLPVIIVKDWSEITEDFLAKKYQSMCRKEYSSDKLFMDYWVKLIRSYKYQ